ncbi:MAG: biopolymer transporter ExbD [Proteobacteria bacterium]|nr:biopolymer transporter ExbD [Pseudomonadota bacterium]
MVFFSSFDDRDDDSSAMMAEINMIPLIDVMLVLLIIFMVAAPLSLSGINVRVPELGREAKNVLPAKALKVVITVAKDGQFFHEKTNLTLKKLEDFLLDQHQQSRSDEKKLIIQADRDVVYARVVTVMNAGKKAGFKNIGLVVRTPD